MSMTVEADQIDQIAAGLPYLRRYARALTGSQAAGDSFAAAALEAILADGLPDGGFDAKVSLFRAFHLVWTSAGSPVGEADNSLSDRAQAHMSTLTPSSREALLLYAIEGFNYEEVGQILDLSPDGAADSVDIARHEMQKSASGKVLIIEDEAIIAMDIAAIVEESGHQVTNIARTRREAVAMASEERPDLILADIQLADNSSGVDAVNDILGQFDALPVIFITAFPERFLTGSRPEPAFLITKPFTEDQVRSAVGQAMFFASTQTLNV